MTHQSDWCLSMSRGGYVAFDNLEEGEPRRMNGVPDEKVVELWRRLADGDLDALEREPWQPGY